MCSVCHQQQPDVPGTAPLQEGAEVSPRLRARMNNLTALALARTVCTIEGRTWQHTASLRAVGGRGLTSFGSFGVGGFLPTSGYQLALSYQGVSIKTSVICSFLLLLLLLLADLEKKIAKEEKTVLEIAMLFIAQRI